MEENADIKGKNFWYSNNKRNHKVFFKPTEIRKATKFESQINNVIF